MVKITEITYSKGFTIQQKEYEPINTHFSAKAEIDELDDINEAYAELKKEVHAQVAIEKDKLEASRPTGVKPEQQAKYDNFPDKPMVTPNANNIGNCTKCGAPNAISKKGNVYCTEKCWLK